MSFPPVNVTATAACDDTVRVVARFDDGSETDLTRGASAFIALGFEIVASGLDAAPAVAALVGGDAVSLDAVLRTSPDDSGARIVLDGDASTSLFVLHHADRDEVLTPHGALSLIAVAVSALLELDSV